MDRALDLLRRCVTPAGFVAALDERANYPRIWSRDGCICGLAALVSGDAGLIAALADTLRTLRRHQGPSGQIPSNVTVDGSTVSYGGKAGRVDATSWYLLATCLYGRLVEGDELVEESWPSLEHGCQALRAWEFNDGGLVYVPVGGDWADEYVLSGYLLYDQVLRLWALREIDAAAKRLGRAVPHQRSELAALLVEHYAPARPGDGPACFRAGFHPGAQFAQFDAFGNALCCLLDLGSPEARLASLGHASRLSRYDLVPAFHPTIQPDQPDYDALQRAAGGRFRNLPGRYHNGGLWPMITGFWALAARRLDHPELGERLRAGICSANRRGDWGFHEYLDAESGEPGGARHQAWSAAAELIATGDDVLGAAKGATPHPPTPGPAG